MKKHISSGAVVLRKNQDRFEVVLMHRTSGDTWHLPKGTQNTGETLEETAIREVKEETGFDIKLGKYVGKIDSTFEREEKLIEKETHYFLAEVVGGDSSAHDYEHDEVLFVEYESALSRLENSSLYEKEAKILKMAESFFA